MDSPNMKPEEIEEESFRIIDAEAGEHGWPGAEWQIVRRAIHTSADFEYAQSMVLSEDVVEKAVAALKSGAGIVTDTNMALSGISKPRLIRWDVRYPVMLPIGMLPNGHNSKGSPAPSPRCARELPIRRIVSL